MVETALAAPALLKLRREDASVDWLIDASPVDYAEAVRYMEDRAAGIARGLMPECVWLLEHPALYTAGTSAKAADLIDGARFPVHASGRGGQYTYHGPGQRVAYVMLDLSRRGSDVRAFVAALEEWLIRTLWAFHVRAVRRSGRVGLWVERPERGQGREDKIAAIGIRVRRWVSFHGISINVDPDLAHFSGIVPCGISDQGITSLADLGLTAGLADVDIELRKSFEDIFGPVRRRER